MGERNHSQKLRRQGLILRILKYILYPYDSSMDEYKNVLFRSLEENQITNVQVFMVDLANVEESMSELFRNMYYCRDRDFVNKY